METKNKQYWIQGSYFFSSDVETWICLGETLPQSALDYFSENNIEIRYR